MSGPMSIWVVAECASGRVMPVTDELAAFASQVRNACSGRVSIVVMGEPVEPLARDLASRTGCEVLGIEATGAARYHPETWVALLASLHQLHPAELVLIPHTPVGWDFAPALSVRLHASCLSSVSGFREDSGGLLFTRQVCGGKLLEDLRPLPGRPAVVTVMPAAEEPREQEPRGTGAVHILKMNQPPPRTRTLGQSQPPQSPVNLQQAEAIVAAGRGLGSEEHLAQVRELASLFKDGAVGASRPVVDLGWLPLGHQVGMTGQSVSPRLYLACGISGMVQHTMGVRNAGLLVSVNKDRNAPFSRLAHYSVVADLGEFLPILIERIRKLRERSPFDASP